MNNGQQQIVLPADVYDTLELSALAEGGIGYGRFSTATVGGAEQPCCIIGHAKACDYESQRTEWGTIWQALLRAEIGVSFNDRLISDAIGSVAANQGVRLSWDAYVKLGNIVRGDN